MQIILQARTFLKGSHKLFSIIPARDDPALFLDLAARCLEQDAAARPPINDVLLKMREYMVKAGLNHLLDWYKPKVMSHMLFYD